MQQRTAREQQVGQLEPRLDGRVERQREQQQLGGHQRVEAVVAQQARHAPVHRRPAARATHELDGGGRAVRKQQRAQPEQRRPVFDGPLAHLHHLLA
eukprot:362158-Prymnesium_polylepis.1